MRCVIATTALLLAVTDVARSVEPTPEQWARFEALQDRLIDVARNRILDLRKELEALKTAKPPKPPKPTPGKRLNQIERAQLNLEFQAQLANFKKRPQYLKDSIKGWEKDIAELLEGKLPLKTALYTVASNKRDFDPVKVGDLGTLWNVEAHVLRVIDENSLLASIGHHERLFPDTRVRMIMPTAGSVDGALIPIADDQVFSVTETYRYGGTTVMTLEPLNLMAIERRLADRVKDRKPIQDANAADRK